MKRHALIIALSIVALGGLALAVYELGSATRLVVFGVITGLF